MSDPGNAAPAPEPTLIEQTGDIPETVIPAEPAPEPVEDAPDDTAAPAADAAPADGEKPKHKPWFQERIDKLTREKHEERKAREALEARLAEIAPADAPSEPAFDPKNFDALVKQEAARLNAAEKAQERTKGWWEAGAKELGADTFNEKCGMVAAMGAGDSPEFMQIITDPEILPDGHKVVAALADHPEEAQRILALEPMKMAAALTRFAETHKAKAAPAPISSAPAPIRLVGGTAKPSAPSDADDIKTWTAKRNAVAWDTQPRN
jgi:hypothetical protein